MLQITETSSASTSCSTHNFHTNTFLIRNRDSTHPGILAGVWRQVLEGPLDVLVRGELAGEGGRLLAAHAEDAVVGGQHAAVEQHHLLVVVVCQDVVEGYVLCHHRILHDQPDVLRTVHTDVVPEGEKCLLVVIGGDGGLRQFGLKRKKQSIRVQQTRLSEKNCD